MMYNLKNDKFKVSFRSNRSLHEKKEMISGKIALLFGGGGHHGASGC